MTKEHNSIVCGGITQSIRTETAAESEIILPDYCPGIMKLVKTDASVFLRSQTIRGDRAYADGAVEFRIVYISETEEGFQSVFYQVPFSCSYEIHSSSADSAQVRAKARLTYVNARALSPQKLYAKAVIDVTMNIFEQSDASLVPPEAADGVITQKHAVKVSDIMLSTQKILKISQEIEPVQGTCPSRIIRYSTSFSEPDKKIINNKMIVKSELTVKVVYCEKQSYVLQYATAKIPVSQVLEVPDGTDENKSFVSFGVCDCRMTVQERAQTGAVIDFDIEVNISAICHADSTAEMITDAYSLTRETETKQKTSSFQRTEDVSSPFDARQTFDIDGAESVADTSVSGEVISMSYNDETKSIKAEGTVNCGIIYRTDTGDYLSCEKAVPFIAEIPASKKPSSIRSCADVQITSCECNLSGRSLEIRASGIIKGVAVITDEITSLSSITVTDKKKDRACGVIVCYVSEGEKVWDIAKRYSADPEYLRLVNSIPGETVDADRMIFVER